MGRVVIPGFRKIEVSGGGEGGTTNYNDLTNKPSINNVPLVGNLNTANLKLTDATLTEEGVPAEAKTVGAKLEEHSTSLLKLTEQLGNHTVKSDVPENAVFTDTVYDDTGVKESISQQSTEILDIKMLGWSVPKECPIQNEVNGNQFIQKVGRTILNGTEDWRYHSSSVGVNGSFYLYFNGGQKPLPDGKGGYFTRFKTGKINDANMNAFVGTDTIQLRVDDCTAPTYLEGNSKIKQWLSQNNTAVYYELATPITTTIDGNEIGETVSDIRKETTVNLLNQTLQTTTINGINCTNNGDGTYTLNGTANGTATFILKDGFNCSQFVGMKLVGCPSKAIVGEVRKFAIVMQATASPWNANANDIGNGSIIVGPSGNSNLFIVVYEGATLDNLVFKPMITTNLNATYDDFVPYTGDSGKLNSDVASLLKRIETLESIVNKTDTATAETE